MCSVCHNNQRITEEIIARLQADIIASQNSAAARDRYNQQADGYMDYDFDCCDYTYGLLEEAVWKGLKQLQLVKD